MLPWPEMTITGGAPAVAQPLQHGHAVDAGQPEIEEDEVELLARELRDRRPRPTRTASV